jgi:glutamate carboxypeptidase
MNFQRYFKARQGEMVNFLKEIVSCESPSHDKKAVDHCSARVVKEFKKLGAKITSIPQPDIGDLFLVEYKSAQPRVTKGPILVLTHTDTVWPVGQLERMPFYVSEEKIFGPGVLDMKSGLAVIIYALKSLYELNLDPQREIHVFINSCEEVGHKEADNLIQKLARKSSCVLCLEPALPDGALKIRRKGRYVVKLTAEGKTAHAGSPENGINAIEELMQQLQIVLRLRTKNISCNTGIFSGGQNVNTVPQTAFALLDIRFWSQSQAEKVKNFFKDLTPIIPGSRIKFSVEKQTPPMEHTAVSAQLLSKVKRIAQSIDLELKTGQTGGGSDASVAANMNIPTLDGLGPAGGGIHAENEYVHIPSFIERTALLTEILLQL